MRAYAPKVASAASRPTRSTLLATISAGTSLYSATTRNRSMSRGLGGGWAHAKTMATRSGFATRTSSRHDPRGPGCRRLNTELRGSTEAIAPVPSGSGSTVTRSPMTTMSALCRSFFSRPRSRASMRWPSSVSTVTKPDRERRTSPVTVSLTRGPPSSERPDDAGVDRVVAARQLLPARHATVPRIDADAPLGQPRPAWPVAGRQVDGQFRDGRRPRERPPHQGLGNRGTVGQQRPEALAVRSEPGVADHDFVAGLRQRQRQRQRPVVVGQHAGQELRPIAAEARRVVRGQPRQVGGSAAPDLRGWVG